MWLLSCRVCVWTFNSRLTTNTSTCQQQTHWRKGSSAPPVNKLTTYITGLSQGTWSTGIRNQLHTTPNTGHLVNQHQESATYNTKHRTPGQCTTQDTWPTSIWENSYTQHQRQDTWSTGIRNQLHTMPNTQRLVNWHQESVIHNTGHLASRHQESATHNTGHLVNWHQESATYNTGHLVNWHQESATHNTGHLVNWHQESATYNTKHMTPGQSASGKSCNIGWSCEWWGLILWVMGTDPVSDGGLVLWVIGADPVSDGGWSCEWWWLILWVMVAGAVNGWSCDWWGLILWLMETDPVSDGWSCDWCLMGLILWLMSDGDWSCDRWGLIVRLISDGGWSCDWWGLN